VRIAYLGPAGTFTEDALMAQSSLGAHDAMRTATVRDAILAVQEGRAERAFVPFENSIEGSVRQTLDTLSLDAPDVSILGEYDHPVSIALIAREPVDPSEISTVISHPQPLAQCARFIQRVLPGAETQTAESTAEAVRTVRDSPATTAALGTRSAAALYDCVVLRDAVEDEPGNVTRFVWIGLTGALGEAGADDEEPGWKTTVVFSELGDDHPGALVAALLEFSSRGVNLTRIESRPRRNELGRYTFSIDLDGAITNRDVAAAIEGLRSQAESVRLLGSYPISRERPETAE